MRVVKYLILLLLFLSACGEEAAPADGEGTDTFLQRMATSTGNANAPRDSVAACGRVLHQLLLVSDLDKKNKAFNAVLHITGQAYTILHTTDGDSMLIWVSYKPGDTGIIKTLAWLQLDMKRGRLYDVSHTKNPAPIFFDTVQMRTIRCSCAFANRTDDSPGISKQHNAAIKMIRNTSYTDAPDYGKAF